MAFSCPKMFDWEDQELANIIWGEVDDHIVPYAEGSENEANEEPANSMISEQKRAASITKLYGGKLESNVDLSFLASNPELNCIGNETDVKKSFEISSEQNEDRELGDIISNNWANIGSFDDLDCMFSDDVLVDHASLDSTDELWTSSRDDVNSSSFALESTSWGLEPLGNSSCQFEFNAEYLHIRNQAYEQEQLLSRLNEGEIDGTTGPNLILEKSTLDVTGKTVSKLQAVAKKVASNSKSSNKDKWLGDQSKHELKSAKINNDREPRDIYGTWLPPEVNVQQFDSQSTPDESKSHLSSVLDQENMPHQSTCLPYQHFPNPYLTTYLYGNLSNEEHQPLLSIAEACLSERVSTNNSTKSRIKSQNMTPRVKIEKLRRRRQMRPSLATKKQQQLSHRVSVTDYSMAQESSEEDQVLPLVKADFESEENMATVFDPNSPLKLVEMVDQSAEDTVLHQLQDVVTNLDMKARLCMRDSLFQLAQSAMDRNGGCGPNILMENISNSESGDLCTYRE